jgi:hypothetical protein
LQRCLDGVERPVRQGYADYQPGDDNPYLDLAGVCSSVLDRSWSGLQGDGRNGFMTAPQDGTARSSNVALISAVGVAA